MFPLDGSCGSTTMQGTRLTDVFALLQLLLHLIHGSFSFKGEMEKDKESPVLQPHNIPTSDQDCS